MSLKKSLFAIFVSIMTLIVMSLGVFFKILKNEKKITAGEAKRYYSYLLADELRQSSDDLTRMARTYVVTGNPKYKEYFQRILDIRNGKAPRPEKYHSIYWDFIIATGASPQIDTKPIPLKTLMKEAEFTTKEFAFLRETETKSNQLVHLETKAMNAMIGFYQDDSGHYTTKRTPDKTLARQLLHGDEYHKAKEKIMRPLVEFFDSIDQRTKEEISIHQTKKKRLSLVLAATMILSILLVLISLFLVMSHFKKEKGENIKGLYSLFKSNIWTSWPFIMSSVVIVFMIVSLSWWFLKETKALAHRDLQRTLKLDLNTTYNTVLDWIDRMKLETSFFSNIVQRHIPPKMFREIQKNQFKNFHQNLKKTGILDSSFFTEYVFTNSAQIVASSSLVNLIGKKFELPQEVLEQIKYSPHQTAYIPQGKHPNPLLTHNILFASRLSKGNGYLFLLASPQRELGGIFRRGFSGNTGEVYMVNSKGQFISEGRWKDTMITRGWLESETASPIGVRVSQAWSNSKAPLTHAVLSVTQGKNNKALHHYKNYLGTKVVGLWRWNNTYQFGIITEMAHKEAFGFFSSYEKQAFLGTFFTVILIFSLTFLFIWNRLKISKVNKELIQTYKTIKKQNDKLARDLLIGQKVQMDMLPDKIQGKGFDLDAYLRPAQTVSGDFYDFAFVGCNKIYFCVGDVSGKGVGAALFMSMTKVSLNKTLDQTNVVEELVTSVNKELAQNNASCMFVTLAVGIMDIETGNVHITNAGHNPPYLKKANGEVVLLEKINGPLVGAFEEAKFEQQSIKMSQGDTLLFYTDGVTEAQNSKEEFYEETRLEKLLKHQEFSSPKHMVNSISKDVMTFIGETSQFDDITILSLKYSG